MANFRGHITAGVGVYLVLVVFFRLGTSSLANHLVWFCAACSGSLFPDIDIYSKGQRLFAKLLVLMILFCSMVQATVPALFCVFLGVSSFVLPHRSLFHNFFFVTALCGAVILFCWHTAPGSLGVVLEAASFFMAGVLSHLVLDKGCKKSLW